MTKEERSRKPKCRECRYLAGDKSIIGIECINPKKEYTWRTSTANYKYPHTPSCKDFEPKGEQNGN